MSAAAPSVLIMRPQAAALRAAEKLRRQGYAPFILPLSRIETLPWHWPQQPCAALLATSANAFSALPPVPAAAKNTPLFCVGGKTAQAAKANGFINIKYTAENVENLCRFLQKAAYNMEKGRIWLYLAGLPRRAVLEEFLTAEKIPHKIIQTYENTALPPAQKELAVLPQILDYILLYSTHMAVYLPVLHTYIGEKTQILCLSPRIAAALPPDKQNQAHIAGKPTQAALFSLLQRLAIQSGIG